MPITVTSFMGRSRIEQTSVHAGWRTLLVLSHLSRAKKTNYTVNRAPVTV